MGVPIFTIDDDGSIRFLTDDDGSIRFLFLPTQYRVL